MSPKFLRYNLILDEGFPPKERFKRLNNRHSPKHIVHDYKKAGLSDEKIYELACGEKSLIITFNVKHFHKLVKEGNKTGVIGISPNLSFDEIDLKLVSFLNKSKKGNLYGKVCYIHK